MWFYHKIIYVVIFLILKINVFLFYDFIVIALFILKKQNKKAELHVQSITQDCKENIS